MKDTALFIHPIVAIQTYEHYPMDGFGIANVTINKKHKNKSWSFKPVSQNKF